MVDGESSDGFCCLRPEKPKPTVDFAVSLLLPLLWARILSPFFVDQARSPPYLVEISTNLWRSPPYLVEISTNLWRSPPYSVEILSNCEISTSSPDLLSAIKKTSFNWPSWRSFKHLSVNFNLKWQSTTVCLYRIRSCQVESGLGTNPTRGHRYQLPPIILSYSLRFSDPDRTGRSDHENWESGWKPVF